MRVRVGVTEDVVIGDAGHKGKGVFAARDFSRGALIMRLRGRVVQGDDLPRLTEWEREHLGELTEDTYQVLPPPRCYLNHSCSANAVSSRDAVFARRDIAAGEEITIDYRLNAHHEDVWEMECRCEAQDGPHLVIGDFFTLPEEVQAEYAPYAPAFIQEERRRRRGAGQRTEGQP